MISSEQNKPTTAQELIAQICEVVGLNPIDLTDTEKQEILELIQQTFDAAIGPYELAIEDRPGQTADNMARNGLRKELRANFKGIME